LWNVIHQRTSLIREPNEVRILRLVRDKGEISRTEISKSINLHKASITDHVAKLIRAGFLEETRKADANERGGRRRTMLRFRPLAGLVAGIDIRKTTTTVALTDLNARVLQEATFEYRSDTSAKEVLAKAASSIQSLLNAAGFAKSKLVGIGIGVQGVIDYTTNTLVLAYNKQSWQGEVLSAALEAEFRVPVYVENDVKAMTLGEYLLGAAKGSRDVVHIWVGDGLGAGIMINGHLHHGITSSAGEIGFNGPEFTSVYREKFPLTYRDQVMFGQILTDANFIESYRRASGRRVEEVLSVSLIARSAMAGERVARQVVDEFVSMLSMLCIPMVNTLNPEVIVIGGELVEHYPSIAAELQDQIHRDLLAPPAEAVRIQPARLGDRGVILGAVGLVLYELFEPLHSFSLRNRRLQNAVHENTD
jgi:predicted NBD/HSP70 family sugar kinase